MLDKLWGETVRAIVAHFGAIPGDENRPLPPAYDEQAITMSYQDLIYEKLKC